MKGLVKNVKSFWRCIITDFLCLPLGHKSGCYTKLTPHTLYLVIFLRCTTCTRPHHQFLWVKLHQLFNLIALNHASSCSGWHWQWAFLGWPAVSEFLLYMTQSQCLLVIQVTYPFKHYFQQSIAIIVCFVFLLNDFSKW